MTCARASFTPSAAATLPVSMMCMASPFLLFVDRNRASSTMVMALVGHSSAQIPQPLQYS